MFCSRKLDKDVLPEPDLPTIQVICDSGNFITSFLMLLILIFLISIKFIL